MPYPPPTTLSPSPSDANGIKGKQGPDFGVAQCDLDLRPDPLQGLRVGTKPGPREPEIAIRLFL